MDIVECQGGALNDKVPPPTVPKCPIPPSNVQLWENTITVHQLNMSIFILTTYNCFIMSVLCSSILGCQLCTANILKMD